MHEKARAEQVVADARQAVKDQAQLDRVRALSADLQQIIHALPSAASPAGAEGARPDGTGAGSRADTGDEEVVDAEFTRE